MFSNKRKFNKMDGICRTCMSSNKPVRSLFEIDTDFIELHVKLYTCFPTFNFDDSDFPTAMCDVCIKMLQNAFKFRELCVKSTCIFLQKRNNKKSKTTNNENETASTNIENNQNSLSHNQNLILNTNDVGTSTDNSDEHETNSNNLVKIWEKTINIFRANRNNNKPVECTPLELSENTETNINSVNFINDKLENIENNNIENNMNKEQHPLNSTQNVNSETQNTENELISKISNNEEHTSTQTPVLMNELQNENNHDNSIDKISEKMYILNDCILLKRKNDIEEQLKSLNQSGTSEENELLIYRTNENENIENEIFELNTESNEEIHLQLTDSQTESENENLNNFVCSIPIEHLNNEIHNEINENCLRHKLTPEERRILCNTNLPEDESNSSESETSLLKPLENYKQNNFIKSALAYHQENIENVDNLEQVEFQDEIEVMSHFSQTSEENSTSSNNDTYKDSEENNEIELDTNTLDTNATQKLLIRDIVSLNKQFKKVDNEDQEVPSVETKAIPMITPIPISKLMDISTTSIQCKEALEDEDEVDDLVNQNVTEVFDFNNHNDHSYAKLHYEPEDDKCHVRDALDLKRKRRTSGRLISLKISKDSKSKMYTASVIDKPGNKSDISPEPPVVKKRQRRTKNSAKSKEDIMDGMPKLIPMHNLIKSNPNKNIIPGIKREYETRGSSVYDFIDELCESSLQRSMPKLREKPTFYNSTDESIDNKIVSNLMNVSATNNTKLDELISNKNASKIIKKRVRKRVPKKIDGPVIQKKLSKFVDEPFITKEEPNVKENIPKTVDDSMINKDIPNVPEKSDIKKYSSNISEETIFNRDLPKFKDETTTVKHIHTKFEEPAFNENVTNICNRKSIAKYRIKKNIVDIKVKKKKLQLPTAVKKNINELNKNTKSRKKTTKEKVIKKELPNPIAIAENKQTEEELLLKKPAFETNQNETQITSSSEDFTAMNLNEVRNEMDLEYPFECDLCGTRRQSLAELEQHLALHMADETKSKLTCTICERKFSSVSGCKRHISMIHKNQSESELSTSETKLSPPESKYSHLCTVCDQVFPTRSSWFVHKKVHTLNQ